MVSGEGDVPVKFEYSRTSSKPKTIGLSDNMNLSSGVLRNKFGRLILCISWCKVGNLADIMIYQGNNGSIGSLPECIYKIFDIGGCSIKLIWRPFIRCTVAIASKLCAILAYLVSCNKVISVGLSDSVWKWCGIHCGSKVEVITLTSFHSPAVSSIIGDLKSCGNQCCKYLWCGKRNIILKYYPYRKCLLILFHHLKSKHYLRSCRIAEFSNSGASWWS